jgi:hypothetical protein
VREIIEREVVTRIVGRDTAKSSNRNRRNQMAGSHHPHLRDNSVRLDNMENSMCAPPLPSPSTLPQDPQLTSALLDTEIDWTTYMQQVSLFLSGERDYSNLKGDTGPLVYPAGHVYIYSGLYYLTDEGRNIKVAQCIFMLLSRHASCGYAVLSVGEGAIQFNLRERNFVDVNEVHLGTSIPPPHARPFQATA